MVCSRFAPGLGLVVEDKCFMCAQDSGVTFVVEGERKQLRGTLTAVSADNPAAQLVGGYKQLHSATRKCRNCLAVNDDMQTKVMLVIRSYALNFYCHDLYSLFQRVCTSRSNNTQISHQFAEWPLT